MIRRISDGIPFITGAILLFGFLELDAYYSRFDIPIFSYISTADIIQLFLPSIGVAVGALAFTTLIFIFFFTGDLEEKFRNKIVSDRDTVGEVLFGKHLWWVALILPPLIFGLFYMLIGGKVVNNTVVWLINLVPIIIVVCIGSMKFMKLVLHREILWIGLLLVSIVPFHIYHSGRGFLAKTRGATLAISFEFDQNPIESGKNGLIYIGEVNDFIFLFNRVAGESLAYKKEGVNRIVYRQLEPHEQLRGLYLPAKTISRPYPWEFPKTKKEYSLFGSIRGN